MNGASRGYGSYRGRGGARTVLKVVIVLLVLILLGAVAAFFYLQQYMVYGDDGTARLELPFLHREEPTATYVPPSDALFTPEPTPTPSPTPTKPQVILPVALTREALFDGTAAQLVTDGGGTAALFDMKGDDGKLVWVSEQPLAISAKTSEDDPAVNVALEVIAEEEKEVYRIARVSCFKDHALSTADNSTAILTNSGYRWNDPDKVRWTSPTSETVRGYLADLCRELAELGFDEILLDNAGYPAHGKLGYIKKGPAYDAEQFESVISGFYKEVAQALEGTETALSIVWNEADSALTGQTLAGIQAAGATPVTRDEEGELHWPAEE